MTQDTGYMTQDARYKKTVNRLQSMVHSLKLKSHKTFNHEEHEEIQ
jgi:hypothetical protein